MIRRARNNGMLYMGDAADRPATPAHDGFLFQERDTGLLKYGIDNIWEQVGPPQYTRILYVDPNIPARGVYFNTLDDALDAVSANDTLILVNARVYLNQSHTINHRITIQSIGLYSTYNSVGPTGLSVVYGTTNQVTFNSYVVFKDIEFIANTPNVRTVPLFICQNYCRVHTCHFQASGGGGPLASGYLLQLTQGGRFFNTWGSTGGGGLIDSLNGSVIVDDCEFGASVPVIRLAGSGAGIIKNSAFTNNAIAGSTSTIEFLASPTSYMIYNNTFWTGAGGYSLLLSSGTWTNAVIHNNILENAAIDPSITLTAGANNLTI